MVKSRDTVVQISLTSGRMARITDAFESFVGEEEVVDGEFISRWCENQIKRVVLEREGEKVRETAIKNAATPEW